MININQCDPNGIRTRVTAVKGRCPGPLDDRVTKARAISELPFSYARQIASEIDSYLYLLTISIRCSCCRLCRATLRLAPAPNELYESTPLRAPLRLDARSRLHARF